MRSFVRESIETMLSCTKCGRWHSDAENDLKRRLSCTEVKQYWTGIRNDHNELYGHFPQIVTDAEENWICMKCLRRLKGPVPSTDLAGGLTRKDRDDN